MIRLGAPPETWHKGIERKSARELALMRQAGRITALALAEMRAHVRPGITTRQLDAIAEKVIAQHDALPAFKGYPGPYPFPNATTISVNEQLVHGIPGPRVLREGDLVSLDCGVRYHGFYADSAISVGVGKCSGLVQRLLEVTEQALWAGIEMMRPGKRTGDVSAAIQDFVEGNGFRVVREYTSHGIGRHMHEDPAVPNYGKPGTGVILRPGMVIALEPMVLVGTTETRTLPDQWTVVSQDGSLTAHFEHTVAVTERAPEVLTRPGDEKI
ncbi:MAG: type I methionyl aminopeptidase [Anaerolineales bacterium]